jgi:hypothetical protein
MYEADPMSRRTVGAAFLRLIVVALILVTLLGGSTVALSVVSPSSVGFAFHAQLIDQSASPTLIPGATATYTMHFRNIGLAPWQRGTSRQVNLGVSGDSTRWADVGIADRWLSPTRVTTAEEDLVLPGMVGTFTFNVRAPATPGVYRIPMRLVVDGLTWLDDVPAVLVLTSDLGFHSQLVDQSLHPTLKPGELSAPLTIRFRNTGAKAWMRGVVGQQANLGVVGDDKSLSGLAVGWPAVDRVAMQTEPSVVPGGIGTFTFRVRAPKTSGMYPLRLRPVVDGLLWMEDDSVVTLITILRPGGGTASEQAPLKPADAPTFTVNGSVDPGTVPAGNAVKITATFASNMGARSTLGIEVYPVGGSSLVYQKWLPEEPFGASESRSYPFTWVIPVGTAPGTYGVNVLAYSAGWKTLYGAKVAAAAFTVAAPQSQLQPPPSAAQTATPSGQTQAPPTGAPTPAASASATNPPTATTSATPTTAPTTPTPTPTSTATLTPTPTPTPIPTPTLYSLQISASPDGSAPSALAGKTVTGGIYVLVLPESGVTQVRFLMDGLLVRTESFAPFPLAGDNGGVLNPYDTTTLVNGPHILTAQVDRSGGTDLLSAAFTVANQAPTPTPSAPPLSLGCPSPAYTRLINVSTPTGLLNAVAAAMPGDKIVLAPGTYNMTTNVLVNRDGTQANPIQLVGPRTAILDFGSPLNYRMLTLGTYDSVNVHGADWWILTGFTTQRSYRGVVLWNSNHNVFCDLLVQQTGQQGFIAKGPLGSSYNVFRQNEIRETGKENAFVGEGFYIGAGGQNAGGGNAWSPSNRNWVYRNKIGPNVTADHVDLKPTTEGNIVEENISDLTGFRFHVGNIAVQGAYTQSQVLSAVIKNNVLTNMSNIEGSTETRAGFFNYQGSNVSYHGNSVSGTGYQEGYRTLGGSGNVVGCDNTAVGYLSGFSNVACQ